MTTADEGAGHLRPRSAGMRTEAMEGGAVGETVRVSVPDALAGERVDRALALLAGVSRAQASRMVADGRVRVGRSTLGTGGRRLPRRRVTGSRAGRQCSRRR